MVRSFTLCCFSKVAYSSMFSEFNYVKNSNDECVLVPGTTPLPDDETCMDGAEYWYERTPYRQIPYSTCEGGPRPDHGTPHRCPGFSSKGFWFWFLVLLLPFGFTGLVAYYYFRRSGMARGCVFLFIVRYSTSKCLSASERFDYQGKSTDQLTEGILGLLLPWLQFLGSSSGLLESVINGSHLGWRRPSELSERGGVDIEMYRLMKMLRSFDLRTKSLEKILIWGAGS
jgi:hypothetical protein